LLLSFPIALDLTIRPGRIFSFLLYVCLRRGFSTLALEPPTSYAPCRCGFPTPSGNLTRRHCFGLVPTFWDPFLYTRGAVHLVEYFVARLHVRSLVWFTSWFTSLRSAGTYCRRYSTAAAHACRSSFTFSLSNVLVVHSLNNNHLRTLFVCPNSCLIVSPCVITTGV
jgi:hypothetical protein